MKKISLLILISLMLSGCGGLGLNKKITLVPDEVWTQYEHGPSSSSKEYKTIKYVGGLKWKFQ